MPNPNTYEGVHGTQRGLDYANFAIRHVDPKIHLLQAEIAPITTLLMNLGTREKAKNPKFEWIEDEMLPHTTAVDNVSGYLATAKLIKVDKEEYGNIGAFAYVVRTKEVMGPVVGQNPATSEIEVYKRGCFGTTPAALNDDDKIIFLRGNIKDGGDAAEAISTLPTLQYNYCEPTSTTFGATEKLEDMETYGNASKLSYQRPKKMKEHMEEREKKVLYGIRGLDTTTGTGVRYAMGGIVNHFLQTTIETITVPTGAAKGFTMKQFNKFIQRLFQYNNSSSSKWLFADGNIVNNIDEFKLQLIDMPQNSLEFNIATKSYRTSFGKLHIVHHRMLNEEFGTDWTAVALDRAKVKLVPYTRQYTRRIPPGRGHLEEYEIFQDETLVMMNEPTHGMLRVVEA